MKGNRGKQQNGKDQRYLQENQRQQGNFHANKGTIKDSTDLTEAEYVKKRWQEYTEEWYKKYLNDPDNHDGVVTHLVPHILECDENGTLGSIPVKKASGISAEIFQILKDDTVKVLLSICQQIWKT